MFIKQSARTRVTVICHKAAVAYIETGFCDFTSDTGQEALNGSVVNERF